MNLSIIDTDSNGVIVQEKMIPLDKTVTPEQHIKHLFVRVSAQSNITDSRLKKDKKNKLYCEFKVTERHTTITRKCVVCI